MSAFSHLRRLSRVTALRRYATSPRTSQARPSAQANDSSRPILAIGGNVRFSRQQSGSGPSQNHPRADPPARAPSVRFEAELDKLAADIKANGLRYASVLYATGRELIDLGTGRRRVGAPALSRALSDCRKEPIRSPTAAGGNWCGPLPSQYGSVLMKPALVLPCGAHRGQHKLPVATRPTLAGQKSKHPRFPTEGVTTAAARGRMSRGCQRYSLGGVPVVLHGRRPPAGERTGPNAATNFFYCDRRVACAGCSSIAPGRAAGRDHPWHR